jgi:hypothetical protein
MPLLRENQNHTPISTTNGNYEAANDIHSLATSPVSTRISERLESALMAQRNALCNLTLLVRQRT